MSRFTLGQPAGREDDERPVHEWLVVDGGYKAGGYELLVYPNGDGPDPWFGICHAYTARRLGERACTDLVTTEWRAASGFTSYSCGSESCAANVGRPLAAVPSPFDGPSRKVVAFSHGGES